MRRHILARPRRALRHLDRSPKRHPGLLIVATHPHAAAQSRALPFQRKRLGTIPRLLLGIHHRFTLCFALGTSRSAERLGFLVMVMMMMVSRRSRMRMRGEMVVVVFFVGFVFPMWGQ